MEACNAFMSCSGKSKYMYLHENDMFIPPFKISLPMYSFTHHEYRDRRAGRKTINSLKISAVLKTVTAVFIEIGWPRSFLLVIST